MGRQRLQQVRPPLGQGAEAEHLLLLLALELLVVEMGGSALVRGEVSGHGGETLDAASPFLLPRTS
jgi:hypothetical protein